MNEINGVRVPFVPITRDSESVASPSLKIKGNSFESYFKTELDKLKFSAHASKRLEARNIELSDNDMQKIREAVDKAELKGSRDTLVMLDSTAFIVNVPNKTVVTAIPVEASEENIFTNIDSVVFAL